MGWLYGLVGSIVIFLGIGLANHYWDKILSAFDSSRFPRIFSRISSRFRHRRFERAWAEYKSSSGNLEMIQAGWKRGKFDPEEVMLTVDGDFELSQEVLVRIRDSHKAEWEHLNEKDNLQIGLDAIDPHRKEDEVGASLSHQLRLSAHKYHYFDFLATNRMLAKGSEEEKRALAEFIPERHGLHPISAFPNPLSVGLSFFCEDGACLVLTRRARLVSNGGAWFGNHVYNAVGENITLRDDDGNYDDSNRLSPWKTAKRGLSEEMGLSDSDIASSEVILHTFAWDRGILDYKFFGYAKSSLSRGEVKQRWISAPDRHESEELIFKDVKTKRQRVQFMRELDEQKQKQDWANETILSTARSMLLLFHDLP